VYSLNAPVPSTVASLATELSRELPGARARPRGTHTLLIKRLDSGTDDARYNRMEARARESLRGTPACEARVTAIDIFEEPPTGSAPVVYLAVESPGLERLHRRVCETFDPVEELEGEGYVPHVTVARGGDLAAARELASREIDPIEWTINELVVWDADRATAVTRLSLPA